MKCRKHPNDFLANRIKLGRQTCNMTQATLARHLGFKSASAINDLEQGKRHLKATDLIILSEIFFQPLSWFFEDGKSLQKQSDWITSST